MSVAVDDLTDFRFVERKFEVEVVDKVDDQFVRKAHVSFWGEIFDRFQFEIFGKGRSSNGIMYSSVSAVAIN